jgi:hypothetical protein
MRMTQADYDERKQRQNDGVASDEDRRLIKQYEQDGYTQSRLTREIEAKQAAADARAAGGGEDDEVEEDDLPDGSLTPRSSRSRWVEFAEKVNAKLAEGERPIADPATATRKDLAAAYHNYAQQG